MNSSVLHAEELAAKRLARYGILEPNDLWDCSKEWQKRLWGDIARSMDMQALLTILVDEAYVMESLQQEIGAVISGTGTDEDLKQVGHWICWALEQVFEDVCRRVVDEGLVKEVA